MTQQSNTHENKNHRRLPPSLTPKISSTTPSEVTSTLPPTKNILSIAKAIIVTASWQSYPRPSAHRSSPHPSLPREILTRRTCREEGGWGWHTEIWREVYQKNWNKWTNKNNVSHLSDPLRWYFAPFSILPRRPPKKYAECAECRILIVSKNQKQKINKIAPFLSATSTSSPFSFPVALYRCQYSPCSPPEVLWWGFWSRGCHKNIQ